MNSLIEKNIISEIECGSCFTYILNDNSIFLSTEYKVLQNQASSCFVKCMKMLYNGKIQLFYHTKSLKPLLSIISSLDPEKFLVVVEHLFADIIDVKHNGFLSCQSIDIEFDKIFIDPTTLSVSLVYLPLTIKVHNEYSTFENGVRTGLVRLISEVPGLSSPKTTQLSDDLSNGSLTIEAIFSKLKGGKGIHTSNDDFHNEVPSKNTMRLITMNAPKRIEILIDKTDFVIGKKADNCDGVVDFNKMISRSHCKIIQKGDQYLVVDLQSANGTFVNKKRLLPNTPHVINNGDVIRMANSDFQVVIG